MSWQNTTLEAPREGGNALLTPGVGNYTITSAEAGPNQWNGRNELTLRVSGPGGSGKTTIPLEPWDTSDQSKIDTFLKMFNNGLGNIGIVTEGRTAVQVLAALPKELPGIAGNVVELNVVHSDRKPKPDGSHLKDDGTPWTDQKIYVNRLVSTGPAPTAQAQAAPAAPSPFDFVPAPADTSDDNIPF